VGRQKFLEFLSEANFFVMLLLSVNIRNRLFPLRNTYGKAPYPSCQANLLISGKLSLIHFEDPAFNSCTAFAMEIVRGSE